MDNKTWNDWYSSRFVQFNINRFSRYRALNFRYKPVDENGNVLLDEHGREVERITRDIPVYRAEDISFLMFDFFSHKKPHFYCTTSRYDWRKVPWPPQRYVNLEEWRNEKFKPAEDSGDFETAKDVVFDIDCRGHVRMDPKDDIARWEDAIKILNRILEFGKNEMKLSTGWIQFTGGGLQLGLRFEELIGCPLTGYNMNVSKNVKFKYHGNWAANTVKIICKTLALTDRYETEKQEGFSFGKINIDLAPNYRRGVFRQPYSIHPKYGTVVWPFSRPEWDNFVPEDLTVFEPKDRLRCKLMNRDMPNLMEE